MFENMKRTRDIKRVLSMWDGDFSNPSISDLIASAILLAPLTCDKKSIFKNNSYIICDASLLSLFYVYDALDNYLNPIELEKLFLEIRKKIFSGLNGLFDIQNKDIEQMYNNRLKAIGINEAFTPIPENLEKYTEEAIKLFAHDYLSKRYVEYSLQSPLPIIGFRQQMQLEMETKVYFNAVIPIISNVIKSNLE